ncbi:uncharacterized protein LOC141602501 [Silene latifolia]|uniref:uncharacterized protein LOC141602501 n=1 Tax=Silene latifolia TaxID=37657 RepID=UPI003D776D78
MSDPSDNKPGKIVNAPPVINNPVAGGRIQQFAGFMWWAMTGLWGLMRLYHTQGLEAAANNNAVGDDIGNNRNQGGAQNVGEINIDANENGRVRAGYNLNDGGNQTIGSVKIKRRRSP